MAEKKLNLQAQKKLAKKLWPNQVTLPTRNEQGSIYRKLHKEGYSIPKAREFYNKYIVDRVEDKKKHKDVENIIRHKTHSTPDAEFVPTKKEIFENRLDARRKEVAKKRGPSPSLGKKMLEVLRYESPQQKEQRLRREPSDDPTGRQRDVSPKQGEFKKGGQIKKYNKGGKVVKRKKGGQVISGSDLVSSLYD